MDRFKFRAYIKYAKLLEDVDSFFIDNLKEKITLHFSDCHTKTMKLSDCVLEQCTGLKDKNGKLIYEGDIVEFYSYSVVSALTGESMKRRVGIVIWNDEWLKFDITVNGEAIPDLCKKTDDNQFVIIGNIHENKDLLEANND